MWGWRWLSESCGSALRASGRAFNFSLCQGLHPENEKQERRKVAGIIRKNKEGLGRDTEAGWEMLAVLVQLARPQLRSKKRRGSYKARRTGRPHSRASLRRERGWNKTIWPSGPRRGVSVEHGERQQGSSLASLQVPHLWGRLGLGNSPGE